MKPVIPLLDDKGEAAYKMATSISGDATCKSYQVNISSGSVFTSTGGLRDRKLCFMSENSGYSKEFRKVAIILNQKLLKEDTRPE